MISNVSSQASVYVNQTPKNGDKINKTHEVLATDKISEITKQIQNGEYKVDIQKTAKAIMQELSAN